jgi:YlmC/YmxH family sporulation protein
MKLSDLQDKDVVNINDGKKIGNIIDVNIDTNGNMSGIMVEKYKFLISLFTNNIIEIKWKQIEKIGKDVILVNLD